MNAKNIAKLVKALVEVEVAKKQEHFLTKTFPKLLEEEVKKKLASLTEIKTEPTQEVDPFSLATAVLEEDRQQTQQAQKQVYSNNPVLNEAIASAKGFEHMDKTVSFGTQDVAMGGGVPPNLQHSMAAKMGYGNIGGGAQKQGLGVQTGLPALDRVLNRDNSALVKAFDKKKGPWRPGMD